ncbi:PQQ-binding-like beta-propeller repeat protein [Aquirufa ecclesiirivi]|uniref:outer membrane protein assembly factor BamB family protein n=1 Tax=Aquirufa ecclesiirivi TaxID=2715124 RepID=UPI001408F395|nr:PQQ-binding-like beta-propeller repeat protein [Aquirufa ecclesiirivi]NHC48613.1 PQQ-binding-like beta-propeller repeat protein [Aquirufa ecclesiirivi]
MKSKIPHLSALGLLIFLLGSSFLTIPSNEDWPSYLGGSDRNHYSTLSQITLENVKQLKVAWSYASGDSGQIQANPIIINGVLYGVNASVQAFALNAATGKEIWRFGDPLKNWASTSRGVSYWSHEHEARILYTAGPNLWALDAKTGKPIPSFGQGGKIDLHTGLPKIAQNKFLLSNTPGTIYQDLIIMPLRLSEGEDAAPGDIRAFDVRTGKLVWTFHTIPYPGEYGYDSFPKDAYKNTYVGAANNWAGMAVDEKRGILFVPTGSAGYDFWGGNRPGSNLFANCLIALDAKTGKRLWHFQTTHHDLWDRDLPAPPNLIRVKNQGKYVDAVAQITKQGFVFLFDRTTGKALFPILEKKVSTRGLAGEKPWPSQPYPSKPAPYARQSFEISHLDVSPFAENKEELSQQLKKFKKDFYAPPSEVGTLIFPGFDGGGEWGGSAADPEKGIIYVNSNEMAWVQKMENQAEKEKLKISNAKRLYQNYCQNCHGAELQGNSLSGYPSLVDIFKRRDKVFVKQIIQQGKGMMPGFTQLKINEIESILSFLGNEDKQEISSQNTIAKAKIPFRMAGYNKFLDAQGRPGIKPPWGTLNAIDMNSGEYLWKIPLGEDLELAKKGIKNTGIENYGGPLITANGILFIAATKDGKFRAFETKTGKLIWETYLPAAGFATPSTYMAGGKQYIVIACGGTKLGTPKNNQYIAFALP